MKIAIESNDGITIKSPFLRTMGYLVYDIEESRINSYEYRKAIKLKKNLKGSQVPVSANLHSFLDDCKTIISRGMNREELQTFRQEGKEVFITFKTSARDAVRLYMQELLLNSGVHH